MKKEHKMPETQRIAVLKMDAGELIDFQLRLQIECEMTQMESANYVAQAFEASH